MGNKGLNRTLLLKLFMVWSIIVVPELLLAQTPPHPHTQKPTIEGIASTEDSQLVFNAIESDPAAPTTVEELAKQLEALESKASESESVIKQLLDANKKAEADKKKLPSVTVNGVFQADAVAFNQSDASREAYGRVESGADFRRARLSAKGAVSDRMDYFMQMDFGFFGRPTFTDVWTDFKDVGPLGTVRVGQWKQPFSLEVVSSFRYTTFMER